MSRDQKKIARIVEQLLADAPDPAPARGRPVNTRGWFIATLAVLAAIRTTGAPPRVRRDSAGALAGDVVEFAKVLDGRRAPAVEHHVRRVLSIVRMLAGDGGCR